MSEYKTNRTLERESYFTDEEVRQILDEQLRRCRRGTTRPSYNRELNYAIAAFAFLTGARASEICSVTIQQVSKALTTGQIKIVGKGGLNSKDRVKRRKFSRNLIIPTQLQDVLANFLTVRANHECDSSNGLLFIGFSGQPLNRHTLWHRFQTCCRQAGIEPKKLHSTRHTAGMMSYGAKKDIVATQEMLGHRSISSTMVYVKASEDSKREIANQMGSVLGLD